MFLLSGDIFRAKTSWNTTPTPKFLPNKAILTPRSSSLTWSSVRVIFREPFAEFFGVFIMILFGNGSVAQVLLSGGEKTAPGMNGFGSYQSISWG
jgi:hypothetical protein